MKLKVYFSNHQDKKRVCIALYNLVRRASSATLDCEGVSGDCEISVTFCDNDGIRELNREYRKKDAPTDVLSFPMLDFDAGDTLSDDETNMLGDIVISLERADAQAAELDHSFEREVAFLCVHSTLHLLGYDHERSPEDERIMIEKQKKIMEKIKIK